MRGCILIVHCFFLFEYEFGLYFRLHSLLQLAQLLSCLMSCGLDYRTVLMNTL